MEISDWINVALCILSFILAVISVVTVIITLKQNSKMIENSTRPYITVYGRVTNFQNPAYYLVVKNMGQTGAEINKFNCNIDLLKFSYSNNIRPLGHMEGTFLAPGQSIITNIDSVKMSEENIDNIIFDITYTSGTKKYQEQYKVHYEADRDNIQARASTKDKELKIISYTLQDLVEKLL
jgi:hypothetical protein